MYHLKPFRHLLLLFAALLTFAACGPGNDTMRLEGTFAGIQEADIYIYSEDGAFEGIDTIHISDGKFEYERKLAAPAVLTLLYPNFTQTYIVGEPGETVKMQGDASKIAEAKVTGTEQNELLSDFTVKHLNDPERNLYLAAGQFVRENPSTLAAVAVFRKYFALAESPDPKTALPLLDLLRKSQPKERAVAYLEQNVRPLLKAGKGESLADVNGVTLSGNKVSVSDYKGKKLVIACIAYWQNDTRTFLRDLRRKLRSLDGKWECMVVSLDYNREMLEKAIENDSISYPVICDRKGFDSPLCARLGIHYVPSLTLVGPQGNILQRDVTEIDKALF